MVKALKVRNKPVKEHPSGCNPDSIGNIRHTKRSGRGLRVYEICRNKPASELIMI